MISVKVLKEDARNTWKQCNPVGSGRQKLQNSINPGSNRIIYLDDGGSVSYTI